MNIVRLSAIALILLQVATAAPASSDRPVSSKEVRHPGLDIRHRREPVADLPVALAAAVRKDAATLRVSAEHVFYDPRGARLASLILSEPLVPGTGEGNTLDWAGRGGAPASDAALEEATWSALLAYLDRHASILRVRTAELSAPRVGVFEGASLIALASLRTIAGIPVRETTLTAVVNHGNLVLLGVENWGDAIAATVPAITAGQAREAVIRHVAPHAVEGIEKEPALEYIPMSHGDGYRYRLAWIVKAAVRDDIGDWEGMVDATSGELLAFEDKRLYARQAVGGVYPVSNDQRPPDGIEQPRWPMPFLDVATAGGNVTTDGGGGLGCATGGSSTALTGRYARVTDSCGLISESAATGDLDLGFGPTPTATDCQVPPGHSLGDTKAARTAFYAVNRINEQARGYLPNTPWLQSPIEVRTNITASCVWSYYIPWNRIEFTRDGGGACASVGELPGMVAHEWGHGLDVHGIVSGISRPQEASADVHAFLRLNTSCIGRGLFKNAVCNGYGDPCNGPPSTGCTGVRDLDFAQRACGQPHTVTWVTSGFPAGHCADGQPRPSCPGGSGTPCGRSNGCESAVATEAEFDLARRDLPAAGFDANTSLEVATRLFFLANQLVTNWYTCNPVGGCGATGGYLLTLAMDDDDGNLGNGTPHMPAIRAAFERHEIHCATPFPVTSGCFGGPTAAAVLTAQPRDRAVSLAWTAVPNAARYAVYRVEGANGSASGRSKIAEVTGLSYVDATLQNGQQYFFLVLPMGTNSSCLGRMSNAAGVVPAAGARLDVRTQHALAMSSGDGDAFLDNCELSTVTFTVENTGAVPLTNLRLVNVAFPTHPSSLLATTLPAPIAGSLSDCASATGSFAFRPRALSPFDALQVRVEVTADELLGQTVSAVLTIPNTEVDPVQRASRTFSFDVDFEGWTVSGGNWSRQGPGAQGTALHVSSSSGLDLACDAIRSPRFVIGPSTTLTIHDRHQIEGTSPTLGYADRANVAVRDVATNSRTVVDPDGGHVYTMTGGDLNHICFQPGERGWNATSPGYPDFNPSSWTAAALNPGGAFTGRVAQIEVQYGTDFVTSLAGMDFDQVTLTDFQDLVPDVQGDACAAQAAEPLAVAVDAAGNGVYQPNETVVMAPTWRNTGTQAIALNGALTSHTGPAGPTYSIPDAAAGYGTLAVGGSASCTAANNCYSIANVAATRPATHWDSTALETVTPTSATKTWTLHVGNSFTDVSGGPFFRFIETLLHRGVTGGCTATTYCPASSTTREQMAVFVLISKEGAAYTPPACVAGSEQFGDVPATSPFCRWIEELVTRGVVAGCGSGNYCPANPVTREQMAIFVLRTLDPGLTPPACVAGSEQFGDVPATSPFCRWIEELANRAVVTGCGGGNYCPAASVTREQMGVFLSVTFGLTLYGL